MLLEETSVHIRECLVIILDIDSLIHRYIEHIKQPFKERLDAGTILRCMKLESIAELAFSEDVGVIGEEAEKKACQEDIESLLGQLSVVLIVLLDGFKEMSHLSCSLHIGRVLDHLLDCLATAPGEEELVAVRKLVERDVYSTITGHVLRNQTFEVCGNDKSFLVLRGSYSIDINFFKFRT